MADCGRLVLELVRLAASRDCVRTGRSAVMGSGGCEPNGCLCQWLEGLAPAAPPQDAWWEEVLSSSWAPLLEGLRNPEVMAVEVSTLSGLSPVEHGEVTALLEDLAGFSGDNELIRLIVLWRSVSGASVVWPGELIEAEFVIFGETVRVLAWGTPGTWSFEFRKVRGGEG